MRTSESASESMRPRQLRWIRPPQQARTQRTLVQLLDAAEALLEDKGFDDVPVSEIALRAGSSVGAFYRRFADKDALLHALHERFCQEAFATADAALDPERWKGSGIAEILGELIHFLIQVHRDRQGLDRAIHQRALSDARFGERSSRLNRHVVRGMSELLLGRRAEIRHPQPQIAVDVSLRQILAFLFQHYTVPVPEVEIVALSDRQVAEELICACLAYLGVRAPDRPIPPIEGENP